MNSSSKTGTKRSCGGRCTSLLRSVRLRVGLGLVVTAFIIASSWLALDRIEAFGELRSVVDELDATDPDWKMEQIEANRPPVGDADNGAFVVIAAYRLLPPEWRNHETYKQFLNIVPPMQAPPKLVKQMSDEVAHIAAAVATGRELRRFSAGRFLVDPVLMFKSEEMNPQTVASALMLHAYVMIEEKDLGQAMEDVRAIMARAVAWTVSRLWTRN